MTIPSEAKPSMIVKLLNWSSTTSPTRHRNKTKTSAPFRLTRPEAAAGRGCARPAHRDRDRQCRYMSMPAPRMAMAPMRNSSRCDHLGIGQAIGIRGERTRPPAGEKQKPPADRALDPGQPEIGPCKERGEAVYPVGPARHQARPCRQKENETRQTVPPGIDWYSASQSAPCGIGKRPVRPGPPNWP